MEFVFEYDENLALEAESTGGSFGTLDTGIYNIKSVVASLSKTKKGNNTVDLSIVTDTGHETIIYGAFMIDKKWASGSDNFGIDKWNQFVGVMGMKTGETAPYTLELSNGNKKELTVFKEVHGKPMVLAIQKELSVYNGEVREKNVIHSSYNEEGKALSEMIAGKPAEKVEKVKERLKDKEDKSYKNRATTSAPQEEESTGSLLD